MDHALLPLRRYARFAGRSRRREYWSFWLLTIVAIVVAIALDNVLGLGGTSSTRGHLGSSGISAGIEASGGALTLVLLLAILVPSLAVGVRRLHDVDRSGWLLLIGAIPFVNLYLLYLMVQPGTAGPNRFGADPITAGG